MATLAGTRYACTDLAPLSGGVGNFVYKGRLREPLDDGTADVVVKHGEPFAAQWSALKLPMYRCVRQSSLLLGPPSSTDGTRMPGLRE